MNRLIKWNQANYLWMKARKHPQFREDDEDRPPSKVLESRGIRTLWVVFVTHKRRTLPWT
jgi:hypothetical protein